MDDAIALRFAKARTNDSDLFSRLTFSTLKFIDVWLLLLVYDSLTTSTDGWVIQPLAIVAQDCMKSKAFPYDIPCFGPDRFGGGQSTIWHEPCCQKPQRPSR